MRGKIARKNIERNVTKSHLKWGICIEFTYGEFIELGTASEENQFIFFLMNRKRMGVYPSLRAYTYLNIYFCTVDINPH